MSAVVTKAADLTSIARAVEERSADRYRELAESFDVACNRDTAQAFRELAADKDRQAASLPAAAPPPAHALDWFERLPEIADPDSVHYLMLPWHAYDLARRAEERVRDHYAALAEEGDSADDLRALAGQLAAQRNEHVAHMVARRDSCPKPQPGWWEDEDGPNWDGD